MKQIGLTQGQTALVDSEDFPTLYHFKWYAVRSRNGVWYAQRKDRGRIVKMHRAILGAPKGIKVDHRDTNGLNNRKENLRLAPGNSNNANSRKQKNNTSGYKGVSWQAGYDRWKAYIRVRGTYIHLGVFTNLIKAAKAYDTAAREHFGEFARCNF